MSKPILLALIVAAASAALWAAAQVWGWPDAIRWALQGAPIGAAAAWFAGRQRRRLASRPTD
jgi:hypothetical protein